MSAINSIFASGPADKENPEKAQDGKRFQAYLTSDDGSDGGDGGDNSLSAILSVIIKCKFEVFVPLPDVFYCCIGRELYFSYRNRRGIFLNYGAEL